MPVCGSAHEIRIEQDIDGVPPADDSHIPDCVLFEKGFDLLIYGIVTHLKGHTEFDPIFYDNRDDSVAVCQGSGHRFLKENMFTRFRGHFHVFGVTVRLGPDKHGVHPRVVQNSSG